MSLEERTLVIRNLDSNRVTRQILEELFNQAGPVVNVVLRSDFAYIEFGHKCSVAYSLALMDGIHLYGQELHLSPKINDESVYEYVDSMRTFNYAMASNPNYFQQFLPNDVSHQDQRHDYRNNNIHENNSRYERRQHYRREESSHHNEKRFRSTHYDQDRPDNYDNRRHYANDFDRRHTPYSRPSHPHRDYDQRMKGSHHSHQYRTHSYR